MGQGKSLPHRVKDSTIRLWDVWNMDPQSCVERACAIVGRNFTQAEWEQYFPGEAYRKTCEKWLLEATPTATP